MRTAPPRGGSPEEQPPGPGESPAARPAGSPCERPDDRNALRLGDRPLPPSSHILVEHFFRHEHGRIVARLTRQLGTGHLDLVLESVQEAGLAALLSWPYDGLPREPAAWLQRVARNRAIDRIRRARWESDDPEELERCRRELSAPEPRSEAEELDDHLRLIFACCHPGLARPVQVALTLKTVCGFGTQEIARAFFVPEATLAQRLVRAKKLLRERRTPYHVPTGAELAPRLESVHEVLLLLFNEGYSSLGGELSVREDLMAEALRLVRFLAGDLRTGTPSTDALDALFCFQSSRNPARLDRDGAMVPLPEQDRSRWDPRRIDAGLRALARSARGDVETDYHLLAEIASVHALTPRFAETDWGRIHAAYGTLLRRRGSNARFLGLVVAASYLRGPSEGLALLDGPRPDWADRGEAHREAAVRADLLHRTGRIEEARVAFRIAAASTWNPAERLYLTRRTAVGTDP